MDADPSWILASPARAMPPAQPLHEVFGLACGLSAVPAMSRSHRHDDVELVLPLGGGAVLEHGGGRHDLDDRECAVFWAGLPHRIADHDDGVAVSWLTVPLADALAWALPASFQGDLLRGRVSTWRPPAVLADVMRTWQEQIGTDAALTQAARLEAQAWLLRASTSATRSTPSGPDDAATRMAAYISTQFREPVQVADVAAHVHLHPSTASAVFRRALGVTIGEYLAQCRTAEAQRLLISTDATTSDVAVRAGFGSTSRFYARFTADVGMPPATYRRRHT